MVLGLMVYLYHICTSITPFFYPFHDWIRLHLRTLLHLWEPSRPADRKWHRCQCRPLYQAIPGKRSGPWVFRGFFMGDGILASYVGIITDQYKDPYQSTSRMESKNMFSGSIGKVKGSIENSSVWGGGNQLLMLWMVIPPLMTGILIVHI